MLFTKYNLLLVDEAAELRVIGKRSRLFKLVDNTMELNAGNDVEF